MSIQQQQNPNPNPEGQITALRIALAALVRRYGTPEAVLPLTVILTIPLSELEAAAKLQLSILPVQHDLEPQPFLQLSLVGD
jgi:hypothetical protein